MVLAFWGWVYPGFWIEDNILKSAAFLGIQINNHLGDIIDYRKSTRSMI